MCNIFKTQIKYCLWYNQFCLMQIECQNRIIIVIFTRPRIMLDTVACGEVQTIIIQAIHTSLYYYIANSSLARHTCIDLLQSSKHLQRRRAHIVTIHVAVIITTMVECPKFQQKFLKIRVTCFESIQFVNSLTSVWIIGLSNSPVNPLLKILPTYYHRNPKQTHRGCSIFINFNILLK